MVDSRNEGIRFQQVSPAKGEQSTTYVRIEGPGPRFSAATELLDHRLTTDLVGNQTNEVDVGTFAIDTVVPSVTALEVQPERINGNPSGQVTVAFT